MPDARRFDAYKDFRHHQAVHASSSSAPQSKAKGSSSALAQKVTTPSQGPSHTPSQASARTQSRLRIVVGILHVVAWTSAGIFLPWSTLSLFSFAAWSLALAHALALLSACCGPAWHPTASAAIWRITGYASLLFMGVLTAGLADAAWTLIDVFGGLGQGIVGTLVVAWCGLALFAIPVGLWALLSTPPLLSGRRETWWVACVFGILVVLVLASGCTRPKARAHARRLEAGALPLPTTHEWAAERARTMPWPFRKGIACDAPPPSVRTTLFIDATTTKDGKGSSRRRALHCAQSADDDAPTVLAAWLRARDAHRELDAGREGVALGDPDGIEASHGIEGPPAPGSQADRKKATDRYAKAETSADAATGRAPSTQGEAGPASQPQRPTLEVHALHVLTHSEPLAVHTDDAPVHADGAPVHADGAAVHGGSGQHAEAPPFRTTARWRPARWIGLDPLLTSLSLQAATHGLCSAKVCLLPDQLVASNAFGGTSPLDFAPDVRFGVSMERLNVMLNANPNAPILTRGQHNARSQNARSHHHPTTAQGDRHRELSWHRIRVQSFALDARGPAGSVHATRSAKNTGPARETGTKQETDKAQETGTKPTTESEPSDTTKVHARWVPLVRGRAAIPFELATHDTATAQPKASGKPKTAHTHGSARPLDIEALHRAADAAQGHIERASSPRHGFFRYQVHPHRGVQDHNTTGIPRQAGTLYSLCSFSRHRDVSAEKETQAIARRTLQRLARNLRRHRGAAASEFPAAGLVDDPANNWFRLGSTALPLVAFLRCRPVVGAAFDPTIHALAHGLLNMQHEDGSFVANLDGDGTPQADPPSLYGAGQAMFALVLYAQHLTRLGGEADGSEDARTGTTQSLSVDPQEARAQKASNQASRPLNARTVNGALRRAMDYFAGPYWSHPLRGLFFVEENWHCLAADAALPAFRHDGYERFCLDYIRFRRRFSFDAQSDPDSVFAGGFGFGTVMPPQTTPTAGQGEALAAAIRILRARRHHDAPSSTTPGDTDPLLLQAEQDLRGLLAFLMRQQWDPIACVHCRKPALIVGGFSESLGVPEIRIDYTQHAFSALRSGADVFRHEAGTLATQRAKNASRSRRLQPSGSAIHGLSCAEETCG